MSITVFPSDGNEDASFNLLAEYTEILTGNLLINCSSLAWY